MVSAPELQPSLPGTTSTTAAPLVKWAGGKRAILREILRAAPKHADGYAEPFLGGGAVFFALGALGAILNDANPDLIQLYVTVRDDHESVARALDELQPLVQDQAAYYRIRSQNPNELEPAARAARFIYLNKTGYNGLYRVNRNGIYNVPFGYRATAPSLHDRENLKRVSQLLASSALSCMDFEPILDRVPGGYFTYVDPPYAPISTTANFTSYTADSFSVADQERLASAVRRAASRGVKVLVSNSDIEMIRVLYAGFRVRSLAVGRRINSDATKRSGTREILISTYD